MASHCAFSREPRVGELNLPTLQLQRLLLDRALQPVEAFDGFEWRDQFQTAAVRYQLNFSDWRWLILSIALVWAAEAINTAVEQLCDLVHPGRQSVVKRVKDLAAGGVLICALAAILIGGATLLPYLHRLGPVVGALH